MARELITSAEIPTHILTVYKNENTPKFFYLTAKQAEAVVMNINNPKDQFIVIADKKICFPKFRANCDLITNKDLEAFGLSDEKKLEIKIKQEEQLQKQRKEKVKKWREKNMTKYDEIFTKILNETKKEQSNIKEEFLNVLVKSKVNVYINKNYF